MGSLSRQSRSDRFTNAFENIAVEKIGKKAPFITKQGFVYDEYSEVLKYGYTITFPDGTIEDVEMSGIIYDPEGSDLDAIETVMGWFNMDAKTVVQKFLDADLIDKEDVQKLITKLEEEAAQ